MKRILLATVPLSLAASLLVMSPPAAHADDRRCTGSIGAVRVDGDVVVPPGASCSLVGTRVEGNVLVYRGAALSARGVRVEGNIQSQGHRKVAVGPRSADGTLRPSYVDGSIQLKSGGGGSISRTGVNGDIQLFSNRGTFTVSRNRVDGNLQCKSNSPSPRGGANRVEGNKEDQCRRL